MTTSSKTPPLTKKARRGKRQARREQQRKASVQRAAKMHAARLEWQRSPEIAMPSWDGSVPHYHVGCSGWFYWHWRGAFYPADLPTASWFEHYADHFQTVELNAPFYSWPTTSTIQSWLRQAAHRDFIYTVKVSELITHVKRFAGTKSLVRDFGHIADILGPRMGCFLFQLPPSFHFTPARLEKIVSQLDEAQRNVVEFRHRSWWDERVFAAFRRAGIIFCSCSGPRLPEDLIKTADDIYIRFHGTKQWYRHDYTLPELAAWVEKIRTSGAARVWAYFNNDRDGHAINNARALLHLVSREPLAEATTGINETGRAEPCSVQNED
ncbi:MAG: DUF72 domain-containing protein [Verrucomicrobia bacterium]|nr:DUF72 domain-containing protein [Verrucomicrobiota bacterium]